MPPRIGWYPSVFRSSCPPMGTQEGPGNGHDLGEGRCFAAAGDCPSSTGRTYASLPRSPAKRSKSTGTTSMFRKVEESSPPSTTNAMGA